MLRRTRSEKGFTLIELLIVVAIIAILAAIAVPNFLEAQVRSKISRVRNDLRSLATAIESYRVDNTAYPLWGQETNGRTAVPGVQVITVAFPFRDKDWRYEWLFTFAVSTTTGQIVGNLTTPVAYITSIPSDPFGPIKGGPLGFYHTGNNRAWIATSMGPKLMYETNWGIDQDIDMESAPPSSYKFMLDPFGSNPTPKLLTLDSDYGRTLDPLNSGAFTYDSTNGTKSKGAIWRVGP